MTTKRHQQVSYLILLAFGMFGFGYALVPLYDVFCEITGLNGKTGDQVVYDESITVDENRKITVEFIAQVNRGMPWEFEPLVKRVEVSPGEHRIVSFRVANPSTEQIVGQAVPSVAPGLAANYFHKTECFCFNQQMLAGGMSMDMPLKFYIDPTIPDDIKRLTLSYTLYQVQATL
ncbi:MAG: cytochrome c oxidase assembly protein [Pseudomonadota bacterium]